MSDTLDSQVAALTADFEGRISLSAKNLETGAAFGLGEDTRVQTASTIKVAIMAAAHAEVGAGRAAWDDVLTLTEAGKAYGAGVLREMDDGLRLTLRDAVNLMIVISDNTATNLVLDRITCNTVNDHLDALGLPAIRSLRWVGGGGESRAFHAPENEGFGLGVATPRAMVRLLEMLNRGQVVSPESSAEMIALLKRQQAHYGIGRGLEGV
jgi:beta-lactamase class A